MTFNDLRQLQQETKAKVSTLCELFDVSRAGFYSAQQMSKQPKVRPLTALAEILTQVGTAFWSKSVQGSDRTRYSYPQ